MINGAHFLLYSRDPEADRAFLLDVIGLRGVDIGHGWIIFALPPSEIAVHPSDSNLSQKHGGHEMAGAILYLMCDDVKATISSLRAKNVNCTKIEREQWGIKTTVPLPSGIEIGLYEPLHKTAI